MSTVLLQTLRSRWFAACVHAACWMLLYLAVTRLGGKAPPYREAPSYPLPARSTVPVSRLEPLLASSAAAAATVTNLPTPFFTRHFVPPAPAPPPEPKTRKIEVTYQGYYQTGDGPKFGMIKVGEGLVATRVGALLVTNLYLAEAGIMSATLTNPAAQTNILPLNAKKEVEVPIR